MRVAFAIMDPGGGGAYYRALLPARTLRDAGHEVVVGEVIRFGDSEWRLGVDLLEGFVDNPQGCAGLRFTDEAGVEGEVFVPELLVLTAGWSLGVEDVLNIGRMAGAGPAGRNLEQTLALDFDDGLVAPPDNAGYRPDQVARKVASALGVDVLVASTPTVARHLEAIGRPVHVIRNVIDPELYASAAAQNEALLEALDGDRGRLGSLVCGYRGPLPWHLEDVRVLTAAAGSLVELGCRFVHVGARSTDELTFAQVLGISEELVERRLQVPFAQYPDQLAGIDVGLVPWARREWSTFKSNIGALEWSAAGVPWVASDQAEYRRLSSASCVSGRFGWPSRVRELLEPSERARVLARQREAAAIFDVSERARVLARQREAAAIFDVRCGGVRWGMSWPSLAGRLEHTPGG